MTLAAGLAINGCVPVLALYSSFLQRAYDQLIHDVAMQNLHVVIGVDRSGIVGADGETHQGLLDLAFLNTVPNMTIMACKDFIELEKMLDFAIDEMNSPVSIRYPRGSESKVVFGNCQEIELGKAEIFDNNMYKKDDVSNIYLPGDVAEGFKAKELPMPKEKINKDFVIKIVGIGKMVTRAFEVA
jgi:1-deoxy-D-xylulose-5-phosphate synthase